MFKKLAHALHHLFNPHCSICESLLREERESQREHELELRVCQSCEALKTQLEFQNQIIRELTKPQAPTEYPTTTQEFEPINRGRFVPWRVRQAELERKDRLQAERLRKEKEATAITVDNLESKVEEFNARLSEAGEPVAQNS